MEEGRSSQDRLISITSLLIIILTLDTLLSAILHRRCEGRVRLRVRRERDPSVPLVFAPGVHLAGPVDEPLEALGPVVPVGGARDDELPGAAGGHEGEADALLGPALLGVELCAEVVYLFEVDLALLALAVLVGVVGECEGVVNSVAEPTLLPVTVDTALLYHKALYNKLLHKLYEKGKNNNINSVEQKINSKLYSL